jgi:adenylyltransferase/sulfurtransferase
MRSVELSSDEMRRYARHLALPEVGLSGQGRIRGASVLCLGAGGLGSAAAYYLAAAGIGKLGIVDSDCIDLTNLQRQILHTTARLGRPKPDSARETLLALNPGVEVVGYQERLTRDNLLGLLSPYDVILDGTDNLPTRYLLNEGCVRLAKPMVHGAVFRFAGQAAVFAPHLQGPCYRCLYPEPPPAELVPDCAQGGLLGVVPGVIGCIQAIETLKLVLGLGNSLLGRMLWFDGLEMEFRVIRLKRDPNCPECGCRAGSPPAQVAPTGCRRL